MTYHKSIAGSLATTSLTVITLLLTNSIGALAQEDLTGTWSCNDGGTYFIRQVGNIIWWYGESAPPQGIAQALATKSDWANVAYGASTGDNIVLFWADVPKGSGLNSGSLALKHSYSGGTDILSKQFDTGGFSGSQWTRSGMSHGQAPASGMTHSSSPVNGNQSKVGHIVQPPASVPVSEIAPIGTLPL
jgi:hypothetical protein